MSYYQTDDWQLEMPANWVAEAVDDAMSLYDPAGNGTLLITTLREEQPISDEYLVELASDHIDAGAELYEVEYGPFSGVTCCYDSENEYWCEWYLRADKLLLFVTYNCPLEDEGAEDDVVEGMLESLTQRAAVPLH